MNKIVFALILWCLSSAACALMPLAIQNGDSIYQKLGSHTEYLEDASKRLSITDITSGQYQYQFTPSRRNRLLFGFTDANVWLRFSIFNTKAQKAPIFLILDQTNLKMAELYEVDNHSIRLIPALNNRDFSPSNKKTLALPNYSFALPLASQQPHTFYLKMHSEHYLMQMPILTSLNTFIEIINLSYLFMGLCFGVLLTLTIYHLYFFLQYRTSVYLYYAAFAFSGLAFFIVHYGFLKTVPWFSLLSQSKLEAFFAWSLLIANTLLVRDFLDVQQTHPRFNRFLNILVYTLSLCLLLTPWLEARTAQEGIILFLFILTSTWAALGVTLYSEAPQGLYYYLIAKCGYCLAAVLALSAMIGQLSLSLNISHFYLGVTLAEAVLMSFALYHRTRSLRRIYHQESKRTLISDTETRAKTEFASQMNHEIKTPMSSILGMAELLSDSSLSIQQKDFVKTIQSSGQQLLKIIDDILDFSKIESGNMELKYNGFDLLELIDESLSTFRAQAREKRLELISHITDDVPHYVIGDAERLKQVLNSLLNHAMRSTERGEVMLAVDVVNAEQSLVRFIITDTGAGTPRNYAERLLTDFSDNPLKLHARYGYAGLGLALTKHLVHMMKGDIHAQTRSGKGGRFWFTIPLPAQDSISKSDLITGLQGLKILIVDDNASYRAVLEQQVAHWGMQPTTAINGTHALAILRTQAHLNEPFHVLLLDQDMPGLSGLQLAHKVKQDGLIADNIVVFMLTNATQLPSAQEREEASVQQVLTKPLSGKQLKLALAQSLGLLETLSSQEKKKLSLIPSASKILLVENHSLTAAMIQGMLQQLALPVTAVDTSEKALAEYATDAYDIILMNLDLPRMNGFQLTQRIRQQENEHAQKKPIPIIGLMVQAKENEQAELVQSSGMNDYVVKPITIDALKEVLAKYK